MSWTVADLLERLRATDETERIEAKRSLGWSARATLSAFANEPDLGGGWMLFGVERRDDGGYEVVGVGDPDKLQTDLVSWCQSDFNRRIAPELKVELLEGGNVVGAFIPEADARDKPVYRQSTGLPKGAYRRLGSSDTRCTDDDLAMFASRARSTPFDRRPAPQATRGDIDPDAIATFRRQLASSHPGSDLHEYDDDDLLQALGALVREDDGLVPSVAGVLLLGSRLALRRLFPAMRVDYIRVLGTEWNVADGDTYDVVEIREPLITAWRRARAAVMEDVPNTFTLPPGSFQRREIPRLPERVIREALINALMHRDYELHGPIQIRRFSNRIEFQNPGYSLLPEERWGEQVSMPRNPTLADAFRDLDLAEERGTGIRRMRSLMRDAGLSMPLFDDDRVGNRFTVTIYFHHLLDEADIEWLGRFEDIDDADAQLLVQARNNGRITNREVRAFSGDDTLAASARLRRLRDRGILTQHGEAKQHTYYVLADLDSAPYGTQQRTLFDEEDRVGTKPGPGRDRGGTESGSEAGTKSAPSPGTESMARTGSRHELGTKWGPRRDQVGTESGPSRDQVELLDFASEPCSLRDLMDHLGWKNRTKFREKLIRPMLKAGWMRMTVPDKPRSRKQRYVRTEAGSQALKESRA